MKICVAQTRPLKGNIPGNIIIHKNLTELAGSKGAKIIVFPELSLTAYEPALARELATTADDGRFDEFQNLSNRLQIIIGTGVPLIQENGICISMIFFYPYKERQLYSKQYLHPDEETFFKPGQSLPLLKTEIANIAPAICYELSVPEHAEKAFRNQAQIYLVSVAKSAEGLEKTHKRLGEIAAQYSMAVGMSSCVGESDGMECGGKTAAWNKNGLLAGQLDNSKEGLLFFDTLSGEVSELYC